MLLPFTATLTSLADTLHQSLPAGSHLAGMAAVFVLAGVVKGVVGLGLPTVAMALLALWLPPAQAAALLIAPSLATNVWQMRPWATLGPLARRLAGMQAGVVVGTVGAAWALGAPATSAWAGMALGLVLLAYAGWSLAGVALTVPAQHTRWLGPLVGVATGLVTAVTGVFVVPAVPYLQALGLQRDELVQAMGLSFTVSTLALAAGLWAGAAGSGVSPFTGFGTSVLMLLPALAGMGLGQAMRSRLSPTLFRRCFLGSLAVLGGYMVAHGL